MVDQSPAVRGLTPSKAFKFGTPLTKNKPLYITPTQSTNNVPQMKRQISTTRSGRVIVQPSMTTPSQSVCGEKRKFEERQSLSPKKKISKRENSDTPILNRHKLDSDQGGSVSRNLFQSGERRLSKRSSASRLENLDDFKSQSRNKTPSRSSSNLRIVTPRINTSSRIVDNSETTPKLPSIKKTPLKLVASTADLGLSSSKSSSRLPQLRKTPSRKALFPPETTPTMNSLSRAVRRCNVDPEISEKTYTSHASIRLAPSVITLSSSEDSMNNGEASTKLSRPFNSLPPVVTLSSTESTDSGSLGDSIEKMFTPKPRSHPEVITVSSTESDYDQYRNSSSDSGNLITSEESSMEDVAPKCIPTPKSALRTPRPKNLMSLRGTKKVSLSKLDVFYFDREQGGTGVPKIGGVAMTMTTEHHSIRSFQLQEGKRPILNLSNDDSTETTPSHVEDLEVYQTAGYLKELDQYNRQRVLTKAGVTISLHHGKNDLQKLRQSRAIHGCNCVGACDPSTCSCSKDGIVCQVDAPYLAPEERYPCKCGDSCRNPSGRIIYDFEKVRQSRSESIMRYKAMEKSGIFGSPTVKKFSSSDDSP